MKRLALLFLLVSCKSSEEPPPLAAPAVKLPIPIELDAGAIEIDAGDPPPRGPGEQFSTYFRFDGESAGRAHNIELAASRFRSFYVKAGTEFSFNWVVGPRSAEAGFVMAPSFFEGVHQQSLGGGVCQVSSTLYAVLMNAAYNVTEWHSHSRKVPYIPEGMDAAVSWADLDLKFIPDHDVWILMMVQSFEFDPDKAMPPGMKKLTAIVSGGEVLRPEVRTKWVKLGVTPFTTRTIRSKYVTKPKIHRAGAVGEPGYRIWQWGDTVLRRDAKYAPVQEVMIIPEEGLAQ